MPSIIQTVFNPATELGSGELLQIARTLIHRATQQTEQLAHTARGQLARHAWSLRQRLKQRFAEQISKEQARIRLLHALELEQKVRLAVADAHRDCLEVALQATRAVVGELLVQDTARIAERVLCGLERLAQGRVLSVAVAPGAEQPVAAALRAAQCAMPVDSAPELTGGQVRLITAHGPVEILWEEEFEEFSNRLRAVLETRISAIEERDRA